MAVSRPHDKRGARHDEQAPDLIPRDADGFEGVCVYHFAFAERRTDSEVPNRSSSRTPKVQAKWATSRANALQLRPVKCDAMADPLRCACEPRFYDKLLGDVTVKPETVCLKKGSVRQGSKKMYC